MFTRNIAHHQLNPYDLHKHLINEYLLRKPGTTLASVFKRDTSRDKKDIDVIREHHRFLWDDNEQPALWEQQLAKRYYVKLFKEYCICDLSRYKENKVALRWRIENEVITGKGQFICGHKTCATKESLRTWEVNFSYVEENMKKNALVKLRLCPECSKKLNYHTQKREVKQMKKRLRKSKNSHLSEPKAAISSESKDTDAVESPEESTNDTSEMQESPKLGQASSQTISEPTHCWTKGPEIEDKNREEEFDEYLENLLL